MAQNRAALVPVRAGPEYSAVGMQCSTEIIAVHTLNRIADYVEDQRPSAAAFREVASDEGDHVHVGRMMVTRFADPDEIPVLREITETKRERITEMLRTRHEKAME